MNIYFSLPVICIIAAVMTFDSLSADKKSSGEKKNQPYRIMFYNTENFFDIFDDTLTADEDFTPSGSLHWTYKRYNTKLRNIYKVIVAVGIWQPPDIVGLCEIETRKVLEDIINSTPLVRYTYRIIHENSADRRGIDAALIYNRERVRFLYSRTFTIRKPGLFTRDILYFKAILGTDTCHFLVNHWPSRSEGQLETEGNRFAAASLLKHITDSLLYLQASAKILIMGDFNDEPSDESLIEKLRAETDLNNPHQSGLYNITVTPVTGTVKGSLKYQGRWNVFDQMIVSGSMLTARKGLTVSNYYCRIFMEPYLLTEDNNYEGYKPYRTYNGFNYQGGFSDHLPVYVDLVSR
jgi:hypothetical protein